MPLADPVLDYAARLMQATHPDSPHALAAAALGHRLGLSFEGGVQGLTPDHVLAAVTEQVRLP